MKKLKNMAIRQTFGIEENGENYKMKNRPNKLDYYHFKFDFERTQKVIESLLDSIKQILPEIEKLYAEFVELEEDYVYRFYHQSIKVFGMQSSIKKAVELFDKLTPKEVWLNDWFSEITDEALSKEFSNEHTNPNWTKETRCIVEAFWHCKYFLQQMETYGKKMDVSGTWLDSGWASVLYLYNLR